MLATDVCKRLIKVLFDDAIKFFYIIISAFHIAATYWRIFRTPLRRQEKQREKKNAKQDKQIFHIIRLTGLPPARSPAQSPYAGAGDIAAQDSACRRE